MNDKEMIDCKICSHKEVCHYHECINDCKEWAKEYQCEYYQPKLPENAVVLTRKEYEQLLKIKENCLELMKQGEQQILNISKETAREILQKIESFYGYYGIEDALKECMQNIAKHYGVDLGE